MCSVTVKKQHCNSLKFAILGKKKKKKLNVVLKTVLFMLFGKKRYCPLVKIRRDKTQKERLVIIFLRGLTLIAIYSIKKN